MSKNFFLTGMMSILFFTGVLICAVSAQKELTGPDVLIPPPSSEVFVTIDALAVPSREARCGAMNNGPIVPGCLLQTGAEYDRAGLLFIYNADGTLWYRFSISIRDPGYFIDYPKKGFQPFAHIGSEQYSDGPILRGIASSLHWVKVEVNEKTQETKFVSKNDLDWALVSWDFWMQGSPKIFTDPSRTLLRDKPNGDIIDHLTDSFGFLKSEGDWAKVRTSHTVPKEGWIKWKQGRELLVGCVFNHFKVPN